MLMLSLSWIQENSWMIFNVFIIIAVILDLYISGKQDDKKQIRNAIYWSVFWIVACLFFAAFIWKVRGRDESCTFLSVYVLEKTLSIDNVMVFSAIFERFTIKPIQQRKALFYGILGALIFRFLFIQGGTFLMHKVFWINYVAGIFLLLTGAFLCYQKNNGLDKNEKESFFLKRIFFIFSKIENKQSLLPSHTRNKNFFYCLLTVEFMDIVFALDSIPVALALTQDSFLIYTANCFAILGLRSLYICFSPLLKKIPNLTFGLGLVIIFIGFKMIFSIHLAPVFSLLLILSILFLTAYKPFSIHKT